MTRGFQQLIGNPNTPLDSLFTTTHALFGLLALSLVACSSGGGSGVVDEGEDDPSTYTVSLLAGSNGSIDPATAQTVVHGENTSFTITPDDGYSIDVMGGCNGTLDGNIYTTGVVTADCTVIVGFIVDGDTAGGAANNYTVTPLIGSNGSISPADAQTVNHGETTSFTITPDMGYSIAEVFGSCGGSLESNTYTTAAISADCIVVASFVINNYTVTPSAGAYGTINPNTSQLVIHGDSVSFTITPDIHYTIADVSSTCGGTLVDNTYTTNAITADCAVSASFVLPSPQDLTITSGQQVNLAWTAVTGATDYCVYVSDTAGITLTNADSYDAVLSLCTGSNNPYYTFTGLDHGTRYYFVVTASDDSSEGLASAEVSGMPVSRPVNDSGINWCANGSSNELDCPMMDYSGQDGDLGRDVDADLVKVGDGAAGFDFTKLGSDGSPLNNQTDDYATTSWACVQDNHTGLMWEVKVNDASNLHHHGHTYTWYDGDSVTNGGNAGTASGGSCGATIIAGCDTEKFVAAVNAAGLCGHDDWRLPTVEELLGIVHNGLSNPAIDQAYFPNTVSGWYWSSSTGTSNSGSAWLVGFDLGLVDALGKSNLVRARLVRTGM